MSHRPASPEENRAPPAPTRLIPNGAKKSVPRVPPVPIVSFRPATILLMRRYSPREPGGNRESGVGVRESSTPAARFLTPDSRLPKSVEAPAEAKLVQRVFYRCHAHIAEIAPASSVPARFLGALTANESAGAPDAARFEPAVYRHLLAVAAGEAPAYAGIQTAEIE